MSETNSTHRAGEPVGSNLASESTNMRQAGVPVGTRQTGAPGVPSEPLDTSNRASLAAASIADPGPLGLGAFAMTTFVLSVVNAKLVDSSVEAAVLGLALFYGGAAQLLAGMWEFRKGNTFGALAFSSFGAFWLSFFYYVSFVAGGIGPHVGEATGLFLLAWAIFTGYMMIASFRVSGIVCGVFIALFLTYIALTIGAFAGSSGFNILGGWLGIITAILAWYASFAGVTNATFKRTVMPTWPLG